jgi:hypothetical protein
LRIVRGGGQEHTDSPHRRLLRSRGERPGRCRAAEQEDEFAPSYA